MSVVKVTSGHKSVKHDIINDTNTKMVVSVGVATFIIVFCIFSARSLISQSMYHGRLIDQKEITKQRLIENKKAVSNLAANFGSFDSTEFNILGGSPTGNGVLDGKNSKIILDALPNRYDYPGLSSSFEKVLKDGGYEISSIGGREDPALVSLSVPTGVAVPVEIPYNFSTNTSLDGTKKLLNSLENWIRPMYVTTLQLNFSENSVQTSISLKTYFTAVKSFELGKQEVK